MRACTTRANASAGAAVPRAVVVRHHRAVPDDEVETRYARAPDGTHLAYQVVGEGDVDVVFVGSWFSHVDVRWDYPPFARHVRRLASFGRRAGRASASALRVARTAQPAAAAAAVGWLHSPAGVAVH